MDRYYYYHIKQPTAFGGLQPLAKVSKKPLRKVEQCAKKQLAYTFHKPVHLHFKCNILRTFKKSYLPGWTEEVFIIKHCIPKAVPVYKIIEYDGTPIKGTFYAQELQRVNVADNVF